MMRVKTVSAMNLSLALLMNWPLALLLLVPADAAAAAPAPDAPRRVVDAAKTPDTVALRRLIDQRMDVNDTDVDGTSALHWAVHRDDEVHRPA